MDRGRWVVRIASLTILLGFFLPSVMVSCSGGFVDASQSFSLADIASYLEQSAIYLLPIAAVAAGILTFFRGRDTSQSVLIIYGQIGAVAVGLISFFGSLIAINDKVQKGTMGLFKVSPAIGSLFLVGGIVVIVIGLVLQWQNSGVDVHHDNFDPRIIVDPIPIRQIHYQEAINNSSSVSSLELVSGNLPTRIIPIHDNFIIGRSSDNNLRLPDTSVSRHHVCLRFAQDMWFLQDQQSSGGTMVNGKNIEASRINDGDEISIGPFRFIFHAGG